MSSSSSSSSSSSAGGEQEEEEEEEEETLTLTRTFSTNDTTMRNAAGGFSLGLLALLPPSITKIKGKEEGGDPAVEEGNPTILFHNTISQKCHRIDHTSTHTHTHTNKYKPSPRRRHSYGHSVVVVVVVGCSYIRTPYPPIIDSLY